MLRWLSYPLLVALFWIGCFQFLSPPPAAHAQASQKIYWTEGFDDELNRSDPDGSNAEQIFGRFSAPEDVALDVASNTMYFVDASDKAVYRASLDGSNVTEIADFCYYCTPRGIALDIQNDWLFVTLDNADQIVRMNTDGSNTTVLISYAEDAQGIVLDPANEHVYWTEGGDVGKSAVRRANLDGTEVTTLVSEPADRIDHIDLDVDGGKMYWTALRYSSPSAIQRANLDGTHVEDVVSSTSTDIGNPGGIAVDTANGFVYWNDRAGGHFRGVRRATLDGDDIAELYTDVRSPSGMALDASNGHLYFTDFALDKIKRINSDGSAPTSLIEAALANYGRFAIDKDTGFLYMTDWTRGQIVRVAPDESTVETIIEGLHNPYSITIDALNQRLYWSELDYNDNDPIRSATLSGQDVTTVLATDEVVGGLAFSATDQKIYWADVADERVRRANPDGSAIETVVSSAPSVITLAIDDQNETLYWSERTDERIRSADLDGSDPTDVITTDAEDVRGLAVDAPSGKLYWADYTGDGVRRANLDGSSIETLASVNSPVNVGLSSNDPLPVELTAFDATWSGERVELAWSTASETNNTGFHVERAVDDGPFTGIEFVNGAGTTNRPQHYRFADEAPSGTVSELHYRLRQVDADGSETTSSIQTVRVAATNFELQSPFPNPAQQQATLRYSLPTRSAVQLEVYDVLGRKVATLVDDIQSPGWHAVTLNVNQTQKLTSGTYLVQLRTEQQSFTQQLTIVR